MERAALAQTRSAIGGFVVGVLLVFIFTKRVGLGMLLGAASAVAMALTGAGRVVGEFLQRGQTHEQITSLSARIDWWTVSDSLFAQPSRQGRGTPEPGGLAADLPDWSTWRARKPLPMSPKVSIGWG